MSNKVIIDGKEYTERSINSLSIDGKVVSGNIIIPENTKPGEIMRVNISVSSESRQQESLQAQEIETQSIEPLEIQEDINVNNTTIKIDTPKKESIISKCMLWIKVFFKSFFQK